MRLVSSTAQIANNLVVFDSYRNSANEFHSAYFAERLRLGKIFVYSELNGKFLFVPSRFAGYANCSMEKHQAFLHKDGKKAVPAISKQLGKAIANAKVEKAYLALCQQLDITPAGKDRTYWRVDIDASLRATFVHGGESGFPDEVETFVEGATKQVIVNAYERSGKARDACLNRHGYSCAVCKFNFADTFGKDLGQNFIHVHHKELISSKGEAKEIDPIEDLIPVCPNCHAMLHQSDPPFLVEELQEIIQIQKALSAGTNNKG